jgi:hypothetical protein
MKKDIKSKAYEEDEEVEIKDDDFDEDDMAEDEDSID